jgi:NAD+ synthase (glutamine-hydrolysing)
MRNIRIALGQINAYVGDLEKNTATIIDSTNKAIEQGADIVVFPELSISGYPPEDLLLRPSFLRDCRNSLMKVVGKTSLIPVIAGFPEYVEGNVFNAAVLSYKGLIQHIYRKIELPNYGIFDEKRYFMPGSKCFEFELNRCRILITICEDVWIENGLVENYAKQSKPDVVINISASPFYAGKLELRRNILSGFAVRTRTTVCYLNIVGGQDELVFDGGSLVIAPNGTAINSAKRFCEDLLITDLSFDGPSPQTSINESKINIVYKPAKKPPVAHNPFHTMELTEEIYETLVLGTKDYTQKNGFTKVAIGLSGGIDSSLVAAIAVSALGKDNVMGVTMPSQYTSNETLSDARLLASNLDIALIQVPIKTIYHAYYNELEKFLDKTDSQIALENLQARIRGNILMTLSNCFGWLVLTTGNKSETAVGYCTLYGDMAGGFAVIKDVPKMLVYKLSEYINTVAGKELIPTGVITRAPTAELRPDQKDEDSLPPYNILDKIVMLYVEKDKSSEQIAAHGIDIDLAKKIIELIDKNEYKRRQSPPGIKITPRAFGKDRRMPVTNLYKNI